MEFDMVFEGGGAKGMVFVGAMQEFEQRGHTYKRLLGTSAGAITASFLAAGYTAQEMMEALAEKDEAGRSVFSSFLGKPGPFNKDQVLQSETLKFLNDYDIPFVPDFIENKFDEAIVKWLADDEKLACSYSFLEYGGVYSADSFIAWIKRRLNTGMNRGKQRNYSDMTLKEFFDETGYDLTLVASDTTAGAMLILNHRTAPDLPLVWAVRMSMSIPLLWQEVVWLKDWGQYRNREMTGHVIVDGGMLSNFPIELFVSQDVHVKSLMGTDAGKAVLGMLIDESIQVEGAQTVLQTESDATPLSRAPLIRRISNLLNTTLSAHDKLVSESFENLVVRLPAGGYGTTEFEMSDDRRNLLVKSGCDHMTAYFNEMERVRGPVSFGIGEEETPVFPVQGAALKQANRTALRILDH